MEPRGEANSGHGAAGAEGSRIVNVQLRCGGSPCFANCDTRVSPRVGGKMSSAN